MPHTPIHSAFLITSSGTVKLSRDLPGGGFVCRNGSMSSRTISLYRKHRFPPEIISHAVWLYHRFSLSFRDVEEMLAERGVIVSYEAVRL
jgi:putative transposase